MAPSPPINEIRTEYNNIYFCDEVTDQSMMTLCIKLRTMDNELTTLSHNYGIKNKIPIYLHIYSRGGYVYAANITVDCISELNNPVYTVVHGLAASAASIISIVGKKRFITPNAYMLIHELSLSKEANYDVDLSDSKDYISHLNEIMKTYYKMYFKHTKLTKKQLDKIVKVDIMWDAKEAIKYGLVDALYV